MNRTVLMAFWLLGVALLLGLPGWTQVSAPSLYQDIEKVEKAEKPAPGQPAPPPGAPAPPPPPPGAAKAPDTLPPLEELTAKAGEAGIFKVRLDSPRATMRTFMVAMNLYLQSQKKNAPLQADSYMRDALRTLNLGDIPEINRSVEGPQAAVFLKEYIDRTIAVDLNKVPDQPARMERKFWELKGTNVAIAEVQDAENPDADGTWLFSPETVANAKIWYEKTKQLPYVASIPLDLQGADYREPWVRKNLPGWAFDEYFGIQLWQWFGLLIFIFLGLTSRALVKALAQVVLPYTRKTRTNVDTLIVERCSGPVALVVNGLVWMLALYVLSFSGMTLTVLTYIVRIVVSIGLIWFFYRLVEVADHFLHKWLAKKKRQDGMDEQLAKLAVQSLKVFVLVFGVLLAVQNLGVNVFSLLAGLGIFGAALAFAAQDTLKNFFGSILIMIDRPFKVGDWVIVGTSEGTVEDIGFRSTRIRTFYNSLITVPNGEVAIQAVDNMGLRTYRRYKTTLGVTYDTPPEKIEAFCEGIKNIIKANPHTRKDYFHVVANDFGASSIDIMLYMFFRVPDWSMELVERHNTICEIIALAKRLEVEFAFPTETIHIESLVKEGVMKQHPAYTREDIAAGAKEFGPGGAKAQPEGTGLYVPPFLDPDLNTTSKKGGGDAGE
ncbi:MAG: mechanosensitive ion channel family protein [Verrucomicrobiota bacterium]